MKLRTDGDRAAWPLIDEAAHLLHRGHRDDQRDSDYSDNDYHYDESAEPGFWHRCARREAVNLYSEAIHTPGVSAELVMYVRDRLDDMHDFRLPPPAPTLHAAHIKTRSDYFDQFYRHGERRDVEELERAFRVRKQAKEAKRAANKAAWATGDKKRATWEANRKRNDLLAQLARDGLPIPKIAAKLNMTQAQVTRVMKYQLGGVAAAYNLDPIPLEYYY